MGIELAGFRFLRYASLGKPLGDTLTLGRQEVHISSAVLRRECGLVNAQPNDPFCEWLLKSAFAASSVSSMDNSTYENATLIHDNNNPVPDDLKDRFDAVLDFGTSEHIFNAAQAIKNCIAMCKQNGLIVHYIPSNNQCGHGFWQASPELFFSVYSKENGFRDTEVFLVAPERPNRFFRVKKPVNGQRANLLSKEALIVAVKTRKDRSDIHTLSVQQSDYLSAWSDRDHKQHYALGKASQFKTWLAQYPNLYETLQKIASIFPNRSRYPMFGPQNPWLEAVDITSDNSGSRA